MKSFSKKSSGLACAAAITAAMLAPAAEAVNLATDGIGEVAIAPYYTTRNGWQTQINLTNTVDTPIVVKIRLHEATNSRDVLDFNVGMSGFDVFTAVLQEGPQGARLVTKDSPNTAGLVSCPVPSSIIAASASGVGTPFSAQGYGVTNPITGTTDTSYDLGVTNIDRLREGYIEFIVMGFTDTFAYQYAANVPATAAGTVVDPVNGIIDVFEALDQHNCAQLDIAFTTSLNQLTGDRRILETARQFGEPINALKFNYSLVNGARGIEAAGDAVAWANFYNDEGGLIAANATNNPGSGDVDGLITASFGIITAPPFGDNTFCTHTRGSTRLGLFEEGTSSAGEWVPGGLPAGVLPAGGPGGARVAGSISCDNLITAQQPFPFLEPSLNDAYPAAANLWEDDLNLPVTLEPATISLAVNGRPRGADAMSLTIQRQAVINEWSSNALLGARTDWVITMPTKGFYVDQVWDHTAAVLALSPNPLPYLTFAQATGGAPFGPTYGVQFAMTGGRPESYLSVLPFVAGANVRQTPPIAPFQAAFNRDVVTDPLTADSCNDVGVSIFDRAEQQSTTPVGGPIVSPAPPVIQDTAKLCSEANIITFNGDSVITPVNPLNINTMGQDGLPPLPNTSGWMLLGLDGDSFTGAFIGADLLAAATVAQQPTIVGNIRGLPVVGINIKERSFGNVTQNYASSIAHGYLRSSISPAQP